MKTIKNRILHLAILIGLSALLYGIASGQTKETGRLFDTTMTRYLTTGTFFANDTILSVETDTVKVKVSYPMKWLWLEYVGVKELWCIKKKENWRFKYSQWNYTYYDDNWKKIELPKIYFRWAN